MSNVNLATLKVAIIRTSVGIGIRITILTFSYNCNSFQISNPTALPRLAQKGGGPKGWGPRRVGARRVGHTQKKWRCELWGPHRVGPSRVAQKDRRARTRTHAHTEHWPKSSWLKSSIFLAPKIHRLFCLDPPVLSAILWFSRSVFLRRSCRPAPSPPSACPVRFRQASPWGV